MIAIPHTDDMVYKALDRAKKMGTIKNSITKGEGNVAGFLGEEAFCSYTGASIVMDKNMYDYDVILDDIKIEIKTKRRTVTPKSHYDVSVANTSKHQKPDEYVFLSLEFSNAKVKTNGQKIYEGLKSIWLLGSKDSKEYFEQATKWNTGDIDTSNKFVTLTDMWNLPSSRLDNKYVDLYRQLTFEEAGLDIPNDIYRQ